MRRSLVGLILVLVAAGCGSADGPMSEDYGNILASAGLCAGGTNNGDPCSTSTDCPGGACDGLVLVEGEHRTGWTRPDCFGCHDVNNIHQVNRTGLPDDVADLAGVREIVNNQGEASCMLCHGANGVAPTATMQPTATATRTSAPTPSRTATPTVGQ